MARAARVTFQFLRRRGFRRSAVFFLVADQRRIIKNAGQFFSRDAQGQNRSIAVHHGRDGGIERVMRIKFGGQFLDSVLIARVHGHQHIGDGDAQTLFAEKAYRGDGAFQGVWELGDRVVNFRTMRIDADLDGVDA